MTMHLARTLCKEVINKPTRPSIVKRRCARSNSSCRSWFFSNPETPVEETQTLPRITNPGPPDPSSRPSTNITMPAPTNIDPKDIQAHLAQYKGASYVDGWAALWDKGDSLPWDRGFPNPALEDALVQRRATIGGPIGQDAQGQSYRRKALVPGCGRGVDVLLLASFGYDAYGLEYSAAAVEACKKEEAENHSWYRVRDQSVGRGKVTFVQGDFFDDGWLQKIGVPLNGFDVIYDYTFFCALNPELRPKWALRHTQLLAPSPAGNLICLEFPRHKDPKAAGPPFPSSSEAYMEHLSHPGEEIPYDNKGLVKQDPLRAPSQNGLERVAYWQPERTHEVGQGDNGVIHDRVSIWRRRN